nr:hypothetical protein GCM10020241_58410 [Streptoalloteichus tenebrarius]
MSEATRRILLNRDLIAVNQDWGGMQGRRVRDDGDQEVWAKPMSDGSVTIVLLNRGDAPSTVGVRPDETGLPLASGYRLRDLWTGEETRTGTLVEAEVPVHDVVVYRIWPTE